MLLLLALACAHTVAPAPAPDAAAVEEAASPWSLARAARAAEARGDLQGAFDDHQGLLVEFQSGAGFAQKCQQLVARIGLVGIAGKSAEQLVEPGLAILAARSIFAHAWGLLSSKSGVT